MKVLLDTDVLLDVLLDRQPWVQDSQAIWQACDDGRLQGFISAISPPNIFYVVRRIAGLDRARACVLVCLDAFDVLPIDSDALAAAAAMSGNDFEDNIHAASAARESIQAIISRDAAGFAGAAVTALSPKEFVARL